VSPTDSPVKVQIVRLPHAAGLDLPVYSTPGSSGMDLRAAVEGQVTIHPTETTAVPTGLIIAVPVGYEAQVRPRSGLALKHGLSVLNSPGTIDSDYRGEVKVILVNLGREEYVVNRGDRIAQLVVCPVVRAAWEEVDRLPDSIRGAGGFGSTGLP
jgi:dUTP pyrophosphatase